MTFYLFEPVVMVVVEKNGDKNPTYPFLLETHDF